MAGLVAGLRAVVIPLSFDHPNTPQPPVPLQVNPTLVARGGFTFEVRLLDESQIWPEPPQALCFGTVNDETDNQPHLTQKYWVNPTTDRWTVVLEGDAHDCATRV
jgi:hypothetical protein